jgi:hypothetical protein
MLPPEQPQRSDERANHQRRCCVCSPATFYPQGLQIIARGVVLPRPSFLFVAREHRPGPSKAGQGVRTMAPPAWLPVAYVSA